MMLLSLFEYDSRLYFLRFFVAVFDLHRVPDVRRCCRSSVWSAGPGKKQRENEKTKKTQLWLKHSGKTRRTSKNEEHAANKPITSGLRECILAEQVDVHHQAVLSTFLGILLTVPHSGWSAVHGLASRQCCQPSMQIVDDCLYTS